MKRILIIEDDIIVSNIYRRKFEISGYDVEVANDGVSGLAKVSDFRPDLVQIDLQLPKMDGVEVIKQIRSRSEFKTLPIIVLSSLYKQDSAKNAWKAGATKCVSKLECTPILALDIISQVLASVPVAPAPAQASAPIDIRPPEPAPATGHTASIRLQQSNACAPGTPVNLDVRQEFLGRVPEIQIRLRDRANALFRANGTPQQEAAWQAFLESVQSLASLAAVTGFHRISHLAAALAILLSELKAKPDRITGSSLRTVALASDTLNVLCQEAVKGNEGVPQSGLILAVDDDPICRRILTNALSKANLRSISMDDPLMALKVLEENQFDLIFLDADMPGMTGFELCQTIRSQAHNKATPVIFVTSLNDFESRAKSSLSGGNDLIAKPFLMIELAVKALTYLLKAKPEASQARSSVTKLARVEVA